MDMQASAHRAMRVARCAASVVSRRRQNSALQPRRMAVACWNVAVAVGVRTAVRFYPQGDAPPGREQGPAAMIPVRIDGLYVVDVGDGECQPVFLTSGQVRGPERTPSRVFRSAHSSTTITQGSASTRDRLGTGIPWTLLTRKFRGGIASRTRPLA